MTTKVTTFSLRLPLSLKAEVEKLAAAYGTSTNQFLVMAAAEKLTAIRTAEAFFAERKGRGDKTAAIRFLTRAAANRHVRATSCRTGEARARRRCSAAEPTRAAGGPNAIAR